MIGPHQNQPVESAGAPLGTSHAVMIMIHGRNAAARNILDIARILDRPQFTFLAPTAANNTWYPFSFMAETQANEPGLSSALAMLRTLVDDVISKGIRCEHIVLLGFSQGACLTTEFAVRNAAQYGAVIAYSGGLIGPPGTTWSYPGSFGGTPVFLGCSDVDSHIPKERVAESAEVFTRMGGSVTKRFYPGMGHMVNDDEIEFTRALMDSILGDTT